MFSHGKAKRHVGYPQNGFPPILLCNPPYRFQSGEGSVFVRAYRHAESVHQNIFPPDSVGGRCFIDFFRHRKPPVSRIGDSVLIQTESHHHAAVMLH